MRKVAYIFSFGHSGSTLLSLVLEQHQYTASIGEFLDLSEKLKKCTNERKCSCGETVFDCPLWGDFYRSIQTENPTDLKAEYGLLLNSFAKNFPVETVLVDSSKGLKNLQELHAHEEVDLRVIYLIKDFRSFVMSTKRKALKRGEKFGLIQAAKNALLWYRGNRNNLNYLEQNAVNYLKLGYEELCLYPQETNETLCSFLDIETTHSTISIGENRGHMIFGNRMRRDSNKNSTIKYDSVWFTDTVINLIGLLLPKVAKFNKKITYSNQFDRMWK